MNPAKLIHAFYRRFNTSATAKDRANSRQSLCHLLRIIIKDTKKIEWLDEFADNNLLWQPSTGLIALNTLSDEQKLAIIEDVSAPTPVKNKTKKQKVRGQYKAKIKKAILVERVKGNDLVVSLLETVFMTANDEKVEEWILDVFKRLDMNRKDQRVNMLETYIKTHNSLVACLPNANNVFLQEGLFKIPHKWNITTDIIGTERYITVVRDFLTEYFPDYPIELIVAHHDERMLDTETGLFKETGAHSHYILSGQNSRTGVFDLNKAQVKVVNDYIKRVGPESDYLPDNGKMSRTQSVIFGHYFQRFFYDYFNQNLLEPRGLKAEFTDETERQSEQRWRMNEESKRPKSQRQYNLNNALSEASAQRLHTLEDQNAAQLEKQNEIAGSILDSQQKLSQKNSLLKEAGKLLADFNLDLSEKNKTLQELHAAIADLRVVTELLGNEYGQHLAALVKDIYVRVQYGNRGLDKQAQQYLLNIVERFITHIPKELQQHCVSAAQGAGDKELEAILIQNMEVSHEALS
jgi:hypothetical protein